MNDFKLCKYCNIIKPRTEFYSKYDKKQPNSVEPKCIQCKKNDTAKNSKRVKSTKPNYKYCYKCKTEKPLTEFYTIRKFAYRNSISSYSYECKQCNIQSGSKRKLFKYRNNKDIQIKHLLRSRLFALIKDKDKSASTLTLLGCSIKELKEHLQQTAILNGYKDFNINTYNSSLYHIDHIVPCTLFNLNCSYHQRLCFNYTNLQILDARKNISKSNHLPASVEV